MQFEVSKIENLFKCGSKSVIGVGSTVLLASPHPPPSPCPTRGHASPWGSRMSQDGDQDVLHAVPIPVHTTAGVVAPHALAWHVWTPHIERTKRAADACGWAGAVRVWTPLCPIELLHPLVIYNKK